MPTYKFCRRTHNLPDHIEHTKEFEAKDRFQALGKAARYWFAEERYAGSLTDCNGVITLRRYCKFGESNVIGTLMDLN